MVLGAEYRYRFERQFFWEKKNFAKLEELNGLEWVGQAKRYFILNV